MVAMVKRFRTGERLSEAILSALPVERRVSRFRRIALRMATDGRYLARGLDRESATS
jgi:hypothetical protein